MTGAQKIRVGVLLAILAGVGIAYLRVRAAERWTPEWDRSQHVRVVLVVPRSEAASAARVIEHIREFALVGSNKATFFALDDWFGQEMRRYRDVPESFRPVVFHVRGPVEVDAPPPAPPRAGEGLSFLERWRRTRDFLAYFDKLRDAADPQSLSIFVYFYPAAEAPQFQAVHSVADRRSRSGFVFAPLSIVGTELAITNTAHETLHLFGAVDKYEGETCRFPDGFYEPFREPRYPQRLAEVMAMGIPRAPGAAEAALHVFEQMRVGVATAAEIGWIPAERRDRYYAGNVAAGPKGD
jgi:hypothetical protein